MGAQMKIASKLYRPFQICRRLSTEEVVVYQCFEVLGRQMFVVQSADRFRLPFNAAARMEAEKQF
jgi:hypothetical protein